MAGRAYQAITAMPNNALRMLNTSATMPLAVKPSGIGGGGRFSPVRSCRLTVLPAALPAVGMDDAAQAAK